MKRRTFFAVVGAAIAGAVALPAMAGRADPAPKAKAKANTDELYKRLWDDDEAEAEAVRLYGGMQWTPYERARTQRQINVRRSRALAVLNGSGKD